MIHIIIMLHFLCFALGVGLISLMILMYKNKQEYITKDILAGELLFSALFLIDSVGIYIRKVLKEYNIENILNIINYLLLAVIIFYLYKIIINLVRKKLYKKFNKIIKISILLFSIMVIIFLLSLKFELIQGVPYLCMIYLFQCIAGIIFIKNEFNDVHKAVRDDKDDSRERNLESGKADINKDGELEIKDEKPAEIIELQNKSLECLTDRECEVVSYICMGLSNKEIGKKLFISPNTVKNHVYNIYKKMNVKNKVELINLVNKP